MWDRLDRPVSHFVGVAAAVVAIAIVALIYLGGQTSSILSTVGASVSGPGSGTASGSSAAPTGNLGATTASAASVAAAQLGPVVDTTRPDLLVVRTGSIELQVGAVPTAVAAAIDTVTAAGGYISDSREDGAGADTTATVTFRVPVDAWREVVADLRSLATRVVAAETRTDNVTAEVVDLTARITNLEVTERALQAIMSQATKIEDVLKIQKELTSIRGEIEVAVARKKQFEDQAAFSTLSVRFGLKPLAAAVVTPQAEFDPAAQVDRATARLIHLLQHAATALIWFGIVWLPFIVVFGVGALVAWLLVRSRRNARPTPGSGTALA